MKHFFAILLTLLFAQQLAAQIIVAPNRDTSKLIQIENSDRLMGGVVNGLPVKIGVGRVRLRQGNVRFECDSVVIDRSNDIRAFGNVLIRQADSVNVFGDFLYYYGNSRLAKLFGNAVMTDKAAKLFTDSLYYDLNTKVGSYTTGGILQNKDTRLFSKRGYYFVERRQAFFREEVRVQDPQFSLKADTLSINTETNIVYFSGPTNVLNKENQIYTEKGFYDSKNDYAEFTQNSKFRSLDGKRAAKGDKIRYDGKVGVSYLEGNASFRDSTRTVVADVIKYDQRQDIYETGGKTQIVDGARTILADGASRYDAATKEAVFTENIRIFNGAQFMRADSLRYNQQTHDGRIFGNVFMQDTTENLTISCTEAEFNDSLAAFSAFGRPLMTTVIEGDTLYLSADVLRSYLAVPSDTTSRIVTGAPDVRIFKSNLQAVCDSMAYTQQDSLFSLFKNPIVWSDTTQFSADTVRIQLANEALDKITLRQQAFIINSPDEIYFNQVKGRDVVAEFRESELYVMRVLGNGEAVYYILDENRAYIGVNKTICSEMLLSFGNNEVTDIRFFTKPNGKFSPMKQADHKALQLAGFRWEAAKRPLSVLDLR
jgi:lipopolysaccharide export system protein LptA